MARQFSGAQLRTARLRAGLKPEQLAVRIDRSVYSIHQYERGVALPSVPVLASLADALACPVDAFFIREAVTFDAAA
ncbi:helix-turn-helix domain-containing protein [Micromonospora globbae]|uniref:helix-turn-helix domain-containing protein n=1 Tax=Micromonospora globbae TaxID=1894969 RepID=UPI00342C6C01